MAGGKKQKLVERKAARVVDEDTDEDVTVVEVPLAALKRATNAQRRRHAASGRPCGAERASCATAAGRT